MVHKYTTQTGKEVIINFPGFKDACDLKRQVELELLKINLNLGDIFSGKAINSDTINTFKNALLILDSSKELEDLIFRCLTRSLYNGLKITQDTFNDIDAIAEFNTIKMQTVVQSVSPFFKNQSSVLSELIKNGKDFLKLQQEMTQKQF